MSGEKRFRTAFYGFNKDDVNTYIEEILQKFESNLREREEEIARLKNENRELGVKYNELAQKANQINEDRARIADVLIKAEEKAQLIVEEAKTQAIDEKNKIEEIIEKEKEKLVDIKEEMRTLKKEIVITLKKYDSQLGVIIDEDQNSQD
jgi:cell division septum initiation protein DivIVA